MISYSFATSVYYLFCFFSLKIGYKRLFLSDSIIRYTRIFAEASVISNILPISLKEHFSKNLISISWLFSRGSSSNLLRIKRSCSSLLPKSISCAIVVAWFSFIWTVASFFCALKFHLVFF